MTAKKGSKPAQASRADALLPKFPFGRISIVCPTPGISCEAVPASDPAGAGMRRHFHPGNHAAESFVSFIPLFDGAANQTFASARLAHSTHTGIATPNAWSGAHPATRHANRARCDARRRERPAKWRALWSHSAAQTAPA